MNRADSRLPPNLLKTPFNPGFQNISNRQPMANYLNPQLATLMLNNLAAAAAAANNNPSNSTTTPPNSAALLLNAMRASSGGAQFNQLLGQRTPVQQQQQRSTAMNNFKMRSMVLDPAHQPAPMKVKI